MNLTKLTQELSANLATPTSLPIPILIKLTKPGQGIVSYLHTILDRWHINYNSFQCNYYLNASDLITGARYQQAIKNAITTGSQTVILFDGIDRMEPSGQKELLTFCMTRTYNGQTVPANVKLILIDYATSNFGINPDETSVAIYDNINLLTPDTVKTIFMDCLVKEETENTVSIESILATYRFDKTKLNENKAVITELLLELPDEFMKYNGGGGYSFLEACMDRHGNLWTGEQTTMEKLFALGMGIGKAKYLLPRSFWSALPGGVPYYIIDNKPDAM